MKSLNYYCIPATFHEREQLDGQILDFVASKNLKPPLSLDELYVLADEFISLYSQDAQIRDWIMVFINNSLWKTTVESIPYKRRILLLPQCLKASATCKAECDEFGLLCRRCNTCSIGQLQDEADSLGLMTLVAEGFTTVAGLIESGQIEAVIGVACLESLEKAFPLLVNHAIPGIAVPLTVAGCKDTELDAVMVKKAFTMRNRDIARPIDFERVKEDVNSWFSLPSVLSLLGEPRNNSGKIALEWLTGKGKRWRPYLQAAVYAAITGKVDVPMKVKQSAVAIECFHKASLIHDDIEDKDDYRYGEETLHKRFGIPLAVNIGDLLLGEGYRLLSLCETGDSEKTELIRIATRAHSALCAGQGMELEWMRQPTTLTLNTVTEIFRLKTAPAFEASIDFGAVCANAGDNLRIVLRNYCDALGIAYQLKDDLDDFSDEDKLTLHPSAVIAAACDMFPQKNLMKQFSGDTDVKEFFERTENRDILEKASAKVRQLYEHYRNLAVRSLSGVDNTDLKRFLFRITGKIIS
jgi:geranylgeranyl pyrophosphate synthase